MPRIKPYNRDAAIAYSNKWAMGRNPAYTDFSPYGGDCTNFISQCLYAGSNVMNYKPTFGWYYISSSNRSPSWTGVVYFYNFLTTNKQKAVFASVIPIEQIELGDVIQLQSADGRYYHSLLVCQINGTPSVDSILVNAHDYDALHRPLFTYPYADFRCLHINGVYI